jgi:hypothetical protein
MGLGSCTMAIGRRGTDLITRILETLLLIECCSFLLPGYSGIIARATTYNPLQYHATTAQKNASSPIVHNTCFHVSPPSFHHTHSQYRYTLTPVPMPVHLHPANRYRTSHPQTPHTNPPRPRLSLLARSLTLKHKRPPNPTPASILASLRRSRRHRSSLRAQARVPSGCAAYTYVLGLQMDAGA